jgi:bacteriocin-like protein
MKKPVKELDRRFMRELDEKELDHVSGGCAPSNNPNELCNGTNKNSNGASGAPGNSFHPGK